MDGIKGKILAFTDQHIGLKNSSKSRLDIIKHVFEYMSRYVDEHKISTIISCGDLFHQRTSLDVNVINVAYKLVSELAAHCRLILICGNHDTYLKNTNDVNSISIFQNIPNVEIVTSIEQTTINGSSALLVPWLGDVSKYSPESFDLMFGHFDASHQYLVKSYVEDNKTKMTASAQMQNILNEEFKASSNAGDFIGNFVDVVKKDGTIFSGHIHEHREFKAKGRQFNMIGSPYQQNFGEKDSKNGFYVLNEDNSYEFVEIPGIPKHVELKMSFLADHLEEFDFTKLSGQIIHKIYDVEIDRAIDAKIMQKINDCHPYEELFPEYSIAVESSTEGKNESIELIKKSKLDYVQNYVNNIDKNVLEKDGLEAEQLFKVLKSYYDKVIEESKK